MPSVKTVGLYFKTGHIAATVDRRRYIPVHEICSSFASVFTSILPAVHALTGCDSVSSLYGIGKKKMIKIIQDKGAMSYEDLQDVGVRNLQSVEKASEKFVCDLYGGKGNREYDINKLRAKHSKLKSASLARLPPCRETLKQHVLRADWQTRVWLCSTTTKPDIPSPRPIGHGWSQADGGIVPHVFDGGTASEVMEELLCACSGRTPVCMECACSRDRLPCTELCSCHAEEKCHQNVLNLDMDSDDDSDDNSDNDDHDV